MHIYHWFIFQISYRYLEYFLRYAKICWHKCHFSLLFIYWQRCHSTKVSQNCCTTVLTVMPTDDFLDIEYLYFIIPLKMLSFGIINKQFYPQLSCLLEIIARTCTPRPFRPCGKEFSGKSEGPKIQNLTFCIFDTK